MSEFLRKLQQAKAEQEQKKRELRQEKERSKAILERYRREDKQREQNRRYEFDAKVRETEAVLNSLGVPQLLQAIKREMKYEWMGKLRNYDTYVCEKTNYDKFIGTRYIYTIQALRYKTIGLSGGGSGHGRATSPPAQFKTWENLGVMAERIADRIEIKALGPEETLHSKYEATYDPSKTSVLRGNLEDYLARNAQYLMGRTTDDSGVWT